LKVYILFAFIFLEGSYLQFFPLVFVCCTSHLIELFVYPPSYSGVGDYSWWNFGIMGFL